MQDAEPRPWQAARVTGTDESLLEGLYESLITHELEGRLSAATDHIVSRSRVDEADEPEILARHVRGVVARALRDERNSERRLAIVNEIVQGLGSDEHLLGTS